MSSIFESIDKTTKLVGKNRLQLLTFTLSDEQLYAINVFKVRELSKLPQLISIPSSHKNFIGQVIIRESTIPVIDLSAAIGLPSQELTEKSNLIVSEYNQSIQGFVVNKIESIINLSWNEISSPSQTAGSDHYLSAFTKVNFKDQQKLISIIDVEKVIAEIHDKEIEIDLNLIKPNLKKKLRQQHILIIDDSTTARNQIKRVLNPLGIKTTEAINGTEGLKLLKSWGDQEKISKKDLLLVLVDAEMPEIDGYKLTHEIRQDKRFKDVFIVLHSSISGIFNQALADKVGYSYFIPKKNPNLIIELIQKLLEEDEL